jgi:hypothetical protein
MSEYNYRVTFVTDYLTVTTNTELDLDEHTGNLSLAAYTLAAQAGRDNVIDELGSFEETLINDITVTLLLDNEDIELEVS